MPGVIVETFTRPLPTDQVAVDGSTYFVAGLAERGDSTGVVELRSMADYATKLGDRVTYGNLYDDLFTFFAEGGSHAYVARVVGAAATKGLLTLLDRAGTPIATVRIDALNEGSWSTRVKIKVDNGVVTNTFKISVLYDDSVVEIYNNLATPAAAVTALGASNYVRAVNLSSATVAPNNNPAVLAATALSAGTDDRGTVTAASYTTAADNRFTKIFGTGAIAVPGQDASAVGTALIVHGADRGRLALLAPISAQTQAQASTAATPLRSTSGNEGAGLFFPWIVIPDGAGGTRTISPEGYVAAMRARAMKESAAAGPSRAPAGAIARARFVVGVERVLTKTEIDQLTADHVNPIRGDGYIRLYGWRSLSTDEINYTMLTGRDVMNFIVGLGVQRLERLVFGTIDGRGLFFEQMASEMRAIVEPMANAGGLYPRRDPNTQEVLDPGYRIDTGPSVNTPTVLAGNEARVDVGVRVSPIGELIRLRLTKVALDVAL